MKLLFVVVLSLFAEHSCYCQKVVNLNAGSVHFTIKNAGLKVNGSIDGFEGTSRIDHENTIISIQGSVDPATIKTGIPSRDNHLQKPDYFSVKLFPKIMLVSTEIKRKNKNSYVGNFDLTIKNITKNFDIPFRVLTKQESHIIEGQFTLNRLYFGLGEESLILSDDVVVYVELLF